MVYGSREIHIDTEYVITGPILLNQYSDSVPMPVYYNHKIDSANDFLAPVLSGKYSFSYSGWCGNGPDIAIYQSDVGLIQFSSRPGTMEQTGNYTITLLSFTNKSTPIIPTTGSSSQKSVRSSCQTKIYNLSGRVISGSSINATGLYLAKGQKFLGRNQTSLKRDMKKSD